MKAEPQKKVLHPGKYWKSPGEALEKENIFEEEAGQGTFQDENGA